MEKTIKIGIIICDRYRRCAGGKCFKAMKTGKEPLAATREKRLSSLATPLAMVVRVVILNMQVMKWLKMVLQ